MILSYRLAQYSIAPALQPCYHEVIFRHRQFGNPDRMDTKLRVNLTTMQLLQIKKSFGFDFDHRLLWKRRWLQEEGSLQAMRTTLIGPLAHPWSNDIYGFFQLGFGWVQTCIFSEQLLKLQLLLLMLQLLTPSISQWGSVVLEECSCLLLLGLLSGGQTRIFWRKWWEHIGSLPLRTSSFDWDFTRVRR